MGKISETIFDGKTAVIPMADVSHIEKRPHGEKLKKLIVVITDKTKLNENQDDYENAIYLTDAVDGEQEATKFMEAWTFYRYEKDLKEGGKDGK